MNPDDPNALCCLLYVSTANPDLTTDDLEVILERSQERNEEDDVTGLLLFCRGHFIQVLEGGAANVDATYERICRDNRHTHIKTMMRDLVDGRFFTDWSMAYRKLPEAAPEQHPSLQALLSAQAKGSVNAVKTLFNIFQGSLA